MTQNQNFDLFVLSRLVYNRAFGFVLLSFAILLFSCSRKNNEKNIAEDSFPQTIELDYSPLILENGMLLNPQKIIQFDSLLVVFDSFEGKELSLWDIKNGTLINRFLDRGHGPFEVGYGGRITKINKDEFIVTDEVLRRTLLFSIKDIVEMENPLPTRKFDFNSPPLKKGECVKYLYYFNDSLMLAMGGFHDAKYLVYNLKSNKANYMYDYPIDNRKEHQNESILLKYTAYQGWLYINESQTKLVYSSQMSFYYEIFDIKGSAIYKTSECVKRLPLYRDCGDGTAAFLRNNTYGLKDFTVGEQNIYSLYNGNSMDIEWNVGMYCNNVFVYSLTGKPIVKYKLKRDVVSIFVDEPNRRIYSIAKNHETLQHEIGFFSF